MWLQNEFRLLIFYLIDQNLLWLVYVVGFDWLRLFLDSPTSDEDICQKSCMKHFLIQKASCISSIHSSRVCFPVSFLMAHILQSERDSYEPIHVRLWSFEDPAAATWALSTTNHLPLLIKRRLKWFVSVCATPYLWRHADKCISTLLASYTLPPWHVLLPRIKPKYSLKWCSITKKSNLYTTKTRKQMHIVQKAFFFNMLKICNFPPKYPVLVYNIHMSFL